MTLDELQSRLRDYFAHRSSEQPLQALGPLVVLTGGWASSLYTFTLYQGESSDAVSTTLVLKTYAPDARRRAHATREWRALTRLRVANYRVPRVILSEPDNRHLGYPFVVMEYLSGASFWDTFTAADPVEQARLASSFVAQLVALHAIDPKLLEPTATLAHPYSYIEHELEQLRRDSANSSRATLTPIVRWLDQRKQAVPCERLAILHRDYHPWNVMVDVTEHLSIIDWDWQIGDARFDLAWTCMLMQRSNFHTFSRAVRREYAQQAGRSIDELAYFEVLTTVRWLLNVSPATESNVSADGATRARFRNFLVQPVARAREFLRHRTGIDISTEL